MFEGRRSFIKLIYADLYMSASFSLVVASPRISIVVSAPSSLRRFITGVISSTLEPAINFLAMRWINQRVAAETARDVPGIGAASSIPRRSAFGRRISECGKDSLRRGVPGLGGVR